MMRAEEGGRGKRLVIKIGSSTLTTSESKIDYGYLAAVAAQIAEAKEAGWHPVVVTSAAIACGLERLGIEKRPHDMPRRWGRARFRRPTPRRSPPTAS